MPDISNWKKIKDELEQQNVTLVAVSKTKPETDIMALYEAGQKIFGENKVQELQPKYEALPKDIQWHMIGHLQSNKVKYIAPFVSMIESVDSLKLLKEINKQAKKQERVIDCLLQIHIAEESSKFGLDKTELQDICGQLERFPNIRICGLMGMATFTEDSAQVKREFNNLKTLFDQTKESYFSKEDAFKQLSMGMSGDYQLAVGEGANMVRIGSLLFGAR